jgi:hypothetical protein
LLKVRDRGWRLAALGGNTIALEWADREAGVWVHRLAGNHPEGAPCRAKAVYRFHSDRVEGGMTVFSGEQCLYRGPDAVAAIQTVMESMMDVWSRSCLDGPMLHAGLVSKQERGMLLCGTSGAGKSSLAAWFSTQGWSYRGDEQSYAGIDWEGFVRPLCFKENWGALFPEVAKSSDWVAQGRGQTLVAPSAFGCQASAERAVRPGVFLFPEYRSGAAFACERLPAGQVTMQLVQATLNGGNLESRGVRRTAEMARAYPGYAVRYGSFAQLTPLLELL